MEYGYEAEMAGQEGFFQLLGLFGWIVILAFYFYTAYTMYRIAQKCGCHSEAWWAYVPILNCLLLCKMAQKPLWWFFLMLIPIVNIIVFFALWIITAKNIGQSPVWGFLAMIPILNFVALSVMAFSGSSGGNSRPQSPSFQQPRTPQGVSR